MWAMRTLAQSLCLMAVAVLLAACSQSSGPVAGISDSSGAVSKPAAATEVTVTGEVMDLMCAQKSEKGGPDHRECALFCVDGRIGPPQPWALRTRDHKVYKVDPSSGEAVLSQLRESVTKFVEVSGTISSEGPISSIVVKSVRPH